MDHKSFYYTVSWDDASVYQRALAAMQIPFTVESPGGRVPLGEGELSISFPDLPVRQYAAVRELFGEDGEKYPGT
ncbi:MAG: hypothetical protein ACM32O_13080 [Clostridia bacterium]